MRELRSFIFIDRLQPQTMCCLGSWTAGSLPRSGMAAQVIEVAPGIDIQLISDIALKNTSVAAGSLVVERQYGYLVLYSRSADEVWSAATSVLDTMDLDPTTARPPNLLSSRVISQIDHQHAFLINRHKQGSMALPGETLFVLEVEPASYAILAANSAEKAADIRIVDYRMMGAAGRVYLTGAEADVRAAATAAEESLGRTP